MAAPPAPAEHHPLAPAARRRAAAVGLALLAVLAPATAACRASEPAGPATSSTAPAASGVPGTPTTVGPGAGIVGLGPGGVPAQTGDPAVDALVAGLDASASVPFTARYDVLRNLGGQRSEALVTQDPPRRAVQVGDVRLVSDPDPATCRASTGGCTEGLAEQALATSVVSSQFTGAAPAAAIRVAMARRSGPVLPSEREVAGLTVRCVTVPYTQGADTWCVTPDGVLAVAETAPVTITLVGYDPAPDPALLSRTPPPTTVPTTAPVPPTTPETTPETTPPGG